MSADSWNIKEAAQAAKLGAIKSAKAIYYGSTVSRSGWWIMFEVPIEGQTFPQWISLRETRVDRFRVFTTLDTAAKAVEELQIPELVVEFGELRRWRKSEAEWEAERLARRQARDEEEAAASIQIIRDAFAVEPKP